MARGRRIEVEILGDSRSLERAFARSSRSGKRFNRDISQAGRGVVAVSGLFSGLGRQVAFASSAFLGGAGLTKVIRDSIGEAADAAKTQRQLAAQFRANGQELSAYQRQIDQTSTRLSQLAGIQDEELTQAFTNAFRGTKNVTAALKVEAVAADVAKGRHVELSAAGIALTKAYLGQTTALKRLGIQIPANVKGMAALELVGRRFAGQAAAGTTAQERLAVAISETEESIGKALLPTVNKITDGITEWLNESENQKRIQEDLTEAVGAAKAVFEDIAAALDAVNTLTGSLKDTIELLVVSFAGLKLVKFATEIRAVGKAWGFVGKQATAAAAAQQIAAAGSLGAPGFRGLGGKGAILPGGVLGAAAAGAGLALGQRGESSVHVGGPLDVSVGPGDIVTYRDPVTGKFILTNGFRGHSAAQLEAFLRADIRKRHPELTPPQVTGEDVAQRNAKARVVAVPKQTAESRSGKGLSLVAQLSRARRAEAKAALTDTQRDDREALQLEAQVLRAQIASDEKKFKNKTDLYNELAAVQDRIQAIDDAAAQKRLDAHEKAVAAAKKARDKERAARKKAHDARVRAAKEAADAAKEAARDFRDLIQTERDRIGELFSGPIFNPSEAQRKAALGAPTPGSNVKALVADLKAQIQQFKAFQRDLATLAKRGAPPQLLAELRQGGLAVAPQVHALAGSGAGDFAKFKGLFIQRERLAVDTAKQERPIINLTVIVNKDTGHVSVKTTPHGQKRGRNPGVVIANAVNPGRR